jgi:hypothetical protein
MDKAISDAARLDRIASPSMNPLISPVMGGTQGPKEIRTVVVFFKKLPR